MKRLALCTAVILGAAAYAGAGCSTGAEDEGDSAAAAASDGELDACKIFIVKDQKTVDLKTFAEDPQHPERKNDPVLQKLLAPVLQGKGCPRSYAAMQKAESIQSCALQTRIASERSALLSAPDVGRALASRSCGSEPTLFFLLDPVDTNSKVAPTLASKPAAQAACNGKAVNDDCTFQLEDDHLTGTCVAGAASVGVDAGAGAGGGAEGGAKAGPAAANGLVCAPVDVPADVEVMGNNSACQSKFAQDDGVKENKGGVRCASCHPGGGMVQKELNSPWTNWMIDPGKYVGSHKELLGTFQDGDSFEGTTTALNTKWAKKRVEIQSKASVKEMLRPLFCTMDINLQAAGNSARADLMIDLLFAAPQQFFGSADGFGSIGGKTIAQLQPQSYKAATDALKQQIAGSFPPGKAFTETVNPFMYPERSNLDHQYVAALKNTNRVSEDLIRDILFVDFTRPIFSPTRCSLAELAGGITDASKAKEQLIAILEAKGAGVNAAEQELLASLKSTGAAPRHQAEVDAYLKVCKDRSVSDNAGFTKDVVTYASHLRQVSRLLKVKLKTEEEPLGIIDFDETLPVDSLSDQPVKDPKLNPATCTLEP